MQRHDCYYHFWSAMLLNAGPPSGPLHGSHYSAGHRWCGSTWLDVMDGGEMVMSETVPSPARSQPLNNYRRVVQPSLNKCSNVDTVEFRWESFKCILFSGTWDSWGLDFWTWVSCPSIHLSVKHHLFPIRGGLEFNPAGSHTLHGHTLILRGAI